MHTRRISSYLTVLGTLSVLVLLGSFLFSWRSLRREESVQLSFASRVSDDSQLLVILSDMQEVLASYRHEWNPEYLDRYLARSRDLDTMVARCEAHDGLGPDGWGTLRRLAWFNETQRDTLSDTVSKASTADLFLLTGYILNGLAAHAGSTQRFIQSDIDSSSRDSFSRMQESERQLRWILLLLIVAITLIVFAFIHLVRHLEHSVSRSLQTLSRLSHHDWAVSDLTDARFTEFAMLFSGINHVKQELHGYVDRLRHQVETERALVDARMRALRGQVNPHFLFNALHQIGVASLVEGPEVVMNLVEATGGILRYSLDMGDDMVSLDDEIGIVRKYLYIQRSCHERKIEAEFDIGSAGALPILPMSIQPLVENSMKHGFTEQREGPFRIAIKARVEGHSLVVSIRDNGVGFKDGAPGKGNGIGLDNIRQRLGLFYGRGDLLSISSIPNQYTEIVVTYPQA